MRQEKLSGLIHHSANFSNLTYCQVEIHFKEIQDRADGGFDEVPASELVISRRATGEKSQYYVNGKSSSYTEVTTLLKVKGVDLDHKRFLILQGEVESISQMKPKAQNDSDEGLLEYLEDIIGTSKYKDPIDESFKEMESLNELRGEKVNRIKLAEGEVKSLESKKKEAEDYLEDENKLAKCKNKFYQYCLWDSKDRLMELDESSAESNKKLEEHEAALNDTLKAIKLKQKEYDDLNADYQNAKQETEMSRKQASKYEKDFIQLEEKRKHLKQKIKKLEKQIEKESLTRSESDVWVRNHTGDLEKKREVLKQYMKTFADAEEELNNIRQSLNGKTDHFQEAIDVKKEELAPWNLKISEKKSEINILQHKLDLLKEKSESDGKVRKEAERLLTENSAALKEKRKTVSQVAGNLEKLSKSVGKKAEQLEDLKGQESELRSLVVELAQQLESTRSSAQAASSRSELVKVLYQERDSGRISGIFGPLSELGSIADKYDVAISSAYSERLKWIVVDTVETAEKCLKVLKAKNAGRASFIVMERLSAIPEKPKTPENAPRLIDLIKPSKESFRKAFYHVVKDTLISEDLEQANRIAFGATRWKVVTLDGKVIDKAGTMSGGGNKQSRGALSKKTSVSDVAVEDIPALDSLRAQRETELKQCREEITDLSREIDFAKKELTKLEKQKFELDSEISSLESQIQNLEKTLSSSTKSAGPNKNELKEMEKMEKDIEKLEKEERDLIKETQHIQEEINKLQTKILEVGGDRLRRQNARVKDLQDEIDLLQESIAHIEGQLKSTEKSQGKSNGVISKAAEEMENAKLELQTVDDEIETKQMVSEDIRKKSDHSTAFLDSKKEALAAAKEELEEASAGVNLLRSQKIEAENATVDVNKSLADLKKRVQNWKLGKQKLKLHHIISIDREQNVEEEQLPEHTEDELQSVNKDKLIKEITILEENIAQAQPNLTVLEEYRERYNEYATRVKDMEVITEQRDRAKGTYDDLRRKRFDEFMAGFTMISRKLKEMYQMITLGGNAELELVDSLDPFSEGIMFSVMPPKKSWKNISNLSGGEKTLSSLALVFALHHFKPTPLYVMDEIDAALDFRNVSIIANYISERTKNAQFVIISLRNNMFELADRLVGIYKTDNTTKSVAINPKAILMQTQPGYDENRTAAANERSKAVAV